MERINKELYESPDVQVVEIKTESGILTLSNNITVNDYPGFGDEIELF